MEDTLERRLLPVNGPRGVIDAEIAISRDSRGGLPPNLGIGTAMTSLAPGAWGGWRLTRLSVTSLLSAP